MSQSPPPENPYQVTASADGERPSFDEGEGLRAVIELARWQTFFAFLLGIGIVLMLGVMAVQMIAIQQAGVVEAIGGLGCLLLFATIFYVVPAVLLWRGAASARAFARGENEGGFTEFARGQAAFWRAIGILAVIIMVLYGVIFLIAIVGGAFF